jgi:hypothetical protein
MPEGRALLGHCAWSPELAGLLEDAGLRTLCIVRDPRDVAVSHAHFLTSIGKSRITRKPEHRALLDLPDHGARLLAVLRGRPGFPSLGSRFREFAGWRDRSGAIVVRFEDLVGEAGGGDPEAQLEAIVRVARALQVPLADGDLARIRDRLYGGTSTFRRGLAGQWREEFGADHRTAAAETLSDVLRDWGYEA